MDNQAQWQASSHQLADKFFKKALSNIEVAQDFFAHHLPEALQEGLDFTSLSFMHNSFIDDDFYKKEADVLYSALIDGHPTYLYLLCEQQSEPDRWLAFRLLVYMVRIMEFHHKNNPAQPLPLVYPLVLYTGAKPWEGPLDVRQLLDAPSVLIERYFLQPVAIIQGLGTTSEEMTEHAWSGTLAWVMSHIKFRDMMQRLKRDLLQALARLDEQESLTYLKDIFWYILEHGEVDAVEFKQVLEQNFKPETGAKLMTLAEQFRREGRQKQAVATAKNLLSINLLSPAQIAQAVGLSLEEVLRCQQKETQRR